MYYMRSPFPTTLPSKLHPFWGHEWSRWVACSIRSWLQASMSA
jgi:hypothetical protein